MQPETRQDTYQPIDPEFREIIRACVAGRRFVEVRYFTDLRELIRTSTMLKELLTREDGEYVRLTMGEEVRLDRLVSVDGRVAPGFPGFDFSCDCNL